MSPGGYNHDGWVAVDDFLPRGQKRVAGYSEESERKRINSSGGDNGPERRESESPGGNGEGGGSGGNSVGIRGRAVNDNSSRKEPPDAGASSRSPPVHPHRLQTKTSYLATSGLTCASPSSAQSSPSDFSRKGLLSDRSKNDNIRDIGPRGSGTFDRINPNARPTRRKYTEDEPRDDSFSGTNTGPWKFHNRRSSGRDLEPEFDNFNDLVKAFTEYTDSVITTSNLMFSRNLVKEKADKRQGLRHRWLKHYRSFASLAEDQSRGTEKVASILDLSDSKIKQNEETQEKTVRRLLSSMFANAVGSSPRPIEDISVNREISTIKADLRDMRTVLDDTKSNKRKTLKYGTPPDDFEQKLRDLAANSITKSAMTEYESKIAQLTVNLSILQNSFSQHENAFAQLPHLQDLIYKLNSVLVEFGQPKEKSADLSARIDDQNHRLQALSDEEQNHYRVLKDDLNEQKNRLQFLSNEVTGCPEKEVKGLFEYITEGRERHDKMQNAMENAIQNLDSELEGFANKMEQVEAKMQNSPATARLESDLDGFKQRIETLEMSLGLLQEREAKPDANPVEPSGGADLADLNKQMQDEVAHLKAKLVDIEQQQDEKDDAVSTEVEKLYASLKLHANETKQLQEEISALRSQVAAPVLNNPLPPPSPVEKSPKVEELLLPKIQAMENDIKKFKEPLIHRTDAMEVLVESLQQRFDNLSTEHLATCIIHQMQKLYPPHPGNVQNEFTQIKNRLGMMDGSIYALWAELAKVNARIEQQAQIAPSLKTEMLETVEGKLKDFAAKKCNGDTGLHDLEGRLSLLLKDSLQKFEQLEQKFTDFKKNSVESYSSLYKNYQELKISVNSQSLQLLTLVGNMTASRVDPTSEKTPTDKELGNMGPGLKMGEKDFVRERSAANVSVPVQKQHTQIDNPTIGAVMTAVTTAATGAAEAEKQPQRQEESTSTPTTDNTTLPEAQSADKKVGGAEASSTPKEAPLSSKRSPDVPLDADPLKGHSSPRTNSNKRNRYSMDGGDDTDSSSEDARPMKIRRRRVSNNAQPQPEPQPQPQTVKDSQRTCSSDDTENDLERPRGLS